MNTLIAKGGALMKRSLLVFVLAFITLGLLAGMLSATFGTGAGNAATNVVVGGTGDPLSEKVLPIAQQNAAGAKTVKRTHYKASGFALADGVTYNASVNNGGEAAARQIVSSPGEVRVISYSQGGDVALVAVKKAVKRGKLVKDLHLVQVAGPNQYDPYGAGIGLRNRLPFSIPGVMQKGDRGNTGGVAATWMSIEDDPISDSPSVTYFVKGVSNKDPGVVVAAAEALAGYFGRHGGQTSCNYAQLARCGGTVTTTTRGNQTFVSVKPRNTALVDLASERLRPLGITIPVPLKNLANRVVRREMQRAKTPEIDQVAPGASRVLNRTPVSTPAPAPVRAYTQPAPAYTPPVRAYTPPAPVYTPPAPVRQQVQQVWKQAAPVVKQIAPQAVPQVKQFAKQFGVNLP